MSWVLTIAAVAAWSILVARNFYCAGFRNGHDAGFQNGYDSGVEDAEKFGFALRSAKTP